MKNNDTHDPSNKKSKQQMINLFAWCDGVPNAMPSSWENHKQQAAN